MHVNIFIYQAKKLFNLSNFLSQCVKILIYSIVYFIHFILVLIIHQRKKVLEKIKRINTMKKSKYNVISLLHLNYVINLLSKIHI